MQKPVHPLGHAFAVSRRVSPEVCASRHALLKKRAQGRPGAGWHPRSAARNAHAERTAQQHTGVAEHSTFPARWSDGLCRALPGAELSLWPPSPHGIGRHCAGWRHAASVRLDRSNDGQDHTVLPLRIGAVRTTRLAQRSRGSAQSITPPCVSHPRRRHASTAARPAARDDVRPPFRRIRMAEACDKTEFL